MTTSPERLDRIPHSHWFWRGFARIDALVASLGWIALCVSGGFAALVFLLLISGALTRPWSNFIFSFAHEASTIMLWPISFLALAAVWRSQGHVRFDLFLRLTRGRLHHLLEFLASVAVLIVAAIFVSQSIEAFTQHYRTGTSTQTFNYRVWPMYSSVVIGNAILSLELIASAFRALREMIEPTGIEEEAYSAFSDSSPGL